MDSESSTTTSSSDTEQMMMMNTTSLTMSPFLHNDSAQAIYFFVQVPPEDPFWVVILAMNALNLFLIVVCFVLKVLCILIISHLNRQQFHVNMLVLLHACCFSWMVVLGSQMALILCGFCVYPESFLVVTIVIVWGPPVLVWLEAVLTAAAFATLCLVGCILVERVFATIYFRDYENRRHALLVFLSAMTLSWTIGIAMSFTVFYLNQLTTIEVASMVFVFGVTMQAILIWLTWFNDRQRFRLLDAGLHRYTLGQRFQMNENIRSARMLQHFLITTGIVVIVIALILLGEFALRYVKASYAVFCLYALIRNIFNLVLLIATIPVLLIIGTATPRCKRSFYRILRRIFFCFICCWKQNTASSRVSDNSTQDEDHCLVDGGGGADPDGLFQAGTRIENLTRVVVAIGYYSANREQTGAGEFDPNASSAADERQKQNTGEHVELVEPTVKIITTSTISALSSSATPPKMSFSSSSTADNNSSVQAGIPSVPTNCSSTRTHHQLLDARGRPMLFSVEQESRIYFDQLARSWN